MAQVGSCNVSSGGSIQVNGPYPSHPKLIHVGETATILSEGIFNPPSISGCTPNTDCNCIITNLRAWLVYADNSFAEFLDLSPSGHNQNLVPGTTIKCPGDPSGFCMPVSQTYVIKGAPIDEGQGLSFSTNWPPGFTSGLSKGGQPFTVLFATAGAGQAISEDASDNGDASPQAVTPLTVLHPCIGVTKNCANACTPYGQPIGFSGVVTNCSSSPNTPLTIILTDDPTATINFAATTSSGRTYDGTLTNNETVAYTGSYQPSGTGAALCGPFTDTITAVGLDVTGFGVTNHASATCNVSTSPAIDLTKDCFKTGSPGVRTLNPGDTYVEVFVVSNTGNVPLQNVSISDDVQGTITIGSLDVGASVTNTTASITPPAGFCGPITDHATASGTGICPANSCTSQTTVTSAQRTCTVTVACPPQIQITKAVTCVPPGFNGVCSLSSGTYGSFAAGVVGDASNPADFPAFCYMIIVTNSGSTVLTNVTINDPDLPGLTVMSTLQIGQSVTNFASKTWGVGFHTNTVTVLTANASSTGAPACAAPGSICSASAAVEVVPISVSCGLTVDQTLLAQSGPVTVCLYVTNNSSQIDQNVAISGLPQLYDCLYLTNFPTPTSVLVRAGQTVNVECGCLFVNCPGGTNFTVTVQGTAVASAAFPCINNAQGQAVQSAPSQCSANVTCSTPTLCRTTGGGTMYCGDQNPDCVVVTTVLSPNVSIKTGQALDHVSHGGQLGAPFSYQDCSQILADQCIRGQWQHNRHYVGPNSPTDVYASDFHTAGTNAASHPIFDTLLCACLGCCSGGQTFPPVTGGLGHGGKFALCNPDDHKICGPEPSPAPDNALIWSGLATLTPATNSTSKGKAQATYAVVRVYVEDRSEPGGNHPKGGVNPADVYVFQAWDTGITVAKHDDPNNLGVSPLIGDVNVFRSTLSADSCAFLRSISVASGNACPPGSLPVPMILGVPATVNDSGTLRTGNQQIHPATGATCPGPGGIPAPAPGPINSPPCTTAGTCPTAAAL
jgi:hypothetical protein